ncbi:MAG TPA: LEPR-XLL domain-containing protein, partial [Candidatus Deferrimicrobiaceae bacterium]|nr:LEPR-XLL domain-containing protein [Candidatus Deferrimicrobiaceae bacterium]
MSLAELFYARQAARRIRRIFPRRRRPQLPRRFEVEPLEPRLLLDAIPPILPNLVAGSIDAPGEVDRYTFTLATDAGLYVDSQTNTSNIRWSLAGPAGTAVSDRALASTDALEGPGLLGLVAGDYTLTVD